MTLGPFSPKFIEPSKAVALEASQWLKTEVLLEKDEMAALLDHVKGELYISGKIDKYENLYLTKNAFLDIYADYLYALKNKTNFKAPFASFFITQDDQSFHCKRISDERCMLHLVAPVLQVQWHSFYFSKEQEKILPMVFGPGSYSWGLQFMMPQLFQKDQKILKALHPNAVPNSALFQRFRKWVRHHTSSTVFQWQDKKIRSSLRLGISCQDWARLVLGESF